MERMSQMARKIRIKRIINPIHTINKPYLGYRLLNPWLQRRNLLGLRSAERIGQRHR
jgi:hypothetical protein